MQPDYPCSNVWNLIASPLEELDSEEEKLWGSLEENYSDEEELEEEDYE